MDPYQPYVQKCNNCGRSTHALIRINDDENPYGCFECGEQDWQLISVMPDEDEHEHVGTCQECEGQVPLIQTCSGATLVRNHTDEHGNLCDGRYLVPVVESEDPEPEQVEREDSGLVQRIKRFFGLGNIESA